MKILLIGNYQPDQHESMQRFANMLQVGLIELGHQVRLIQPEPFFGKIKLSASGLGKWLGYIDKFILFPRRELRRAASWADVVHICDHSNAMYTKYLQNVPHLVTCHDLLAIRSALGEIKENCTKWTGKQLQQMILSGLKRSQRIACVSEQTETDMLRLAKINPDIVSVIYNGLNYPYAPMEKAEAHERLDYLVIYSNSPFILHVGGNHWYKNRLGVLSIFNYLRQQHNLLDLYLVMAGKPFTNQMRQFVQQNSLNKQVIELVAVENEDLRALYSAATALLFPSLQEGFGWPIAEAQTCGCPVFTSNRAPMTEVGGDAAIYINPNCPEEAAREIANNLKNVSKLKQAGLINAQRFTSQKMLSSYIELYQEICQ
jgi:glycosyltransferase involved in cell wall biosynthesis